MSWYCWLGVALCVGPALWLWLFVGSWAVELVGLLTRSYTSDEMDYLVFGAVWPVVLVIGLVVAVVIRFRGAATFALDVRRRRNRGLS